MSVLPVSKAEIKAEMRLPANMLQVIWNSKMREEVLAQLESAGQDPQASAPSAQVGTWMVWAVTCASCKRAFFGTGCTDAVWLPVLLHSACAVFS